MKIVVAGTGFVGLTHAAVLAENGHEVHAYDIDLAKIDAYASGDRERIEHYVNEPGLVEESTRRSGGTCSSSAPTPWMRRSRASRRSSWRHRRRPTSTARRT